MHRIITYCERISYCWIDGDELSKIPAKRVVPLRKFDCVYRRQPTTLIICERSAWTHSFERQGYENNHHRDPLLHW